eukprot:FR740385.1.p2 GENE.FR740385.1~~FR740385.1.p2  ORF type:complete len:136 (-),score=30.59 FR740385.1:15-422(-)
MKAGPSQLMLMSEIRSRRHRDGDPDSPEPPPPPGPNRDSPKPPPPPRPNQNLPPPPFLPRRSNASVAKLQDTPFRAMSQAQQKSVAIDPLAPKTTDPEAPPCYDDPPLYAPVGKDPEQERHRRSSRECCGNLALL